MDSETNEGLLTSELERLDDQLEQLISADFRADGDYTIPYKWNGARSRTVVFYSDEAVTAFPSLVLGIQDVLSNAKQDWIIYLQTHNVNSEFIVWVHPDKVVVTDGHAATVRSLIDSREARTKH